MVMMVAPGSSLQIGRPEVKDIVNRLTCRSLLTLGRQEARFSSNCSTATVSQLTTSADRIHDCAALRWQSGVPLRAAGGTNVDAAEKQGVERGTASIYSRVPWGLTLTLT